MAKKPDKPSRPGKERPAPERETETPTPGLLIRLSGKPKPEHAPAAQEKVGSILRVAGGDKYKMGPLVAKGGMGEVHEAEDLNCRRVVAMKGLPKDHPVPPEYRTRFIEEAQITSQLEHPNIVPIHELGFDVDQNVYYTMKYIRGIRLTDVLMGLRKGDEDVIEQYPLSRLLNVFQKVCDAIAFAHSRGFVHCDLKPDNIMICDFGEVVVMDWGLARAAGSTAPALSRAPDAVLHEVEPGGSPRKRGSAPVFGTPGFIAPERVLSDDGATTRWDVYSLGATLFSILVLRPPVTGGGTKTVLRRAVAGDILPPASYNEPERRAKLAEEGRVVPFPHCPEGKIPTALSEAVMKAMATRPEERYLTVQDLQTDVETYQNGLIWHLVVDQNFSGENPLEKWEVVGGQYEIRNGELRINYGQPQLLLYRGDVPGDARIEFECRQDAVYLNSVGCFLGAVRSENRKEIPMSGYKFEYGGFDNSLNVIERAGRQLINEPRSCLQQGATYRVRAERVGGRLRLIVNDEEVLAVTDPDPLFGADHTAVGLFGWLAETIITRVRIYTLGTPWKSDTLDIAERQSLKGNYSIAVALVKEVMDSYPDAVRMERAKKVMNTALWREKIARELVEWREKLAKAWPGLKFDVRMGAEGLALELPPGNIEGLEPLRGMPLTSLICASNRIPSLEPLRGMPLTTLSCSGNTVTSLEPLRGMKLNTFVAECCPIDSIEPLAGMPIRLLNFGGGRVESLEPLRGMPLTLLACWGNRVSDLGPLSSANFLTLLYCSDNHIRSLEPLRGLSIVTMNCSGNEIKDLEPLEILPLKVLHCGDNRIESLEPLMGIALRMLSCQGNRIRSLEPLKGAPLVSLICGANPLTSVEVLADKPPDDFRFDSDTIPTEELERLHKKWLPDEAHPWHARNVEVLLALRRSDLNRLRAMASEFRGRRYLLIPKLLRWEEAKAFCEGLGGHLLTILSQEENDFINSLFPNGCWFWMGLKTTERGHEWVTGEPVEFTSFMDILQGRKLGHKVFTGRWASDDVPAAHNSFMIQWDK